MQHDGRLVMAGAYGYLNGGGRGGGRGRGLAARRQREKKLERFFAKILKFGQNLKLSENLEFRQNSRNLAKISKLWDVFRMFLAYFSAF